MAWLLGDNTSGALTPWATGAVPFVEMLQQALGAQSIALGVISFRQPLPDAFVVVHQVSAQRLAEWCEAGFREDALLRDAQRQGVATEPVSALTTLPFDAEGHVLVAVHPTTMAGRIGWYLAISRPQAFDERDQQKVELLLRLLQSEFDHISETGMGRLILGHDNRLIHADPRTESHFVGNGGALSEISERLHPVIHQRWPELDDNAAHDLALELGGRPTWVRFRRVRPIADLSQHHWYLELRPLTEHDIPPVGLVEDDRVARAMAYLSDHFASSPALSDVAQAVSTSPFHFHRLFVRHVGVSPKHFLLRMQLMIAKWMLRASRTPIGDIATATGFASHGHFTATFHRMIGVSPSTYREEQ